MDASGWVLNPVLELLRDRQGVPVEAAERHPLVAIFAVETFVIIEAALAEVWRKGLEAALADVAGLKSYLTEWYGEDTGGEPDWTSTLRDCGIFRQVWQSSSPGRCCCSG